MNSIQSKPNFLNACRSVDCFENIMKISEGTFGVVYKARNIETGEIVALKRLKVTDNKSGIPITFLREIKILLQQNHPNLLNVKEVVKGQMMNDFYLVMEYIDFDLYDLIQTTSSKTPFISSEIKCIMKQLLQGVSHLHKNWVMHRDLKTSNLLLSTQGILKIADFGSAKEIGFADAFNVGQEMIPAYLKQFSQTSQYTQLSSSQQSKSQTPSPSPSPSNQQMQKITTSLLESTHGVTTPLYRAPEIFLGSTRYSFAIDIWACGCIFAELIYEKPFFEGKKEFEIMNCIFSRVGIPDEDSNWPGWKQFPGAKTINIQGTVNKAQKGTKLTPLLETGKGRQIFSRLTNSGYDLLLRMLTLCPERRITAEEALKHPYFDEQPLPSQQIEITDTRIQDMREKHQKKLGIQDKFNFETVNSEQTNKVPKTFNDEFQAFSPLTKQQIENFSDNKIQVQIDVQTQLIPQEQYQSDKITYNQDKKKDQISNQFNIRSNTKENDTENAKQNDEVQEDSKLDLQEKQKRKRSRSEDNHNKSEKKYERSRERNSPNEFNSNKENHHRSSSRHHHHNKRNSRSRSRSRSREKSRKRSRFE